MAWTEGKVKALKFLYRSFWSTHAIAAALDMTVDAVGTKIKRLRRAEDPDIALGFLARCLARAAGLHPLDAPRALEALQQPGVRAALSWLTQSETDREGGQNEKEKKMLPTIGRIVHYRLTPQDADEINRRRNDALNNLAANDGAIRHVGNYVYSGALVAMVVAAVYSDICVNGQLILDGNDSLWVTSRMLGEGDGEWSWPAIVRPEAGTQVAAAELNPNAFTPAAA